VLLTWVHQPAAEVGGPIRRHLRAALQQWDVPDDVAEDAVLLVSELVANVVDHARTPFRLTLRLTGRVLRVAVADGSGRLPVLRPVDLLAARGRGLQVVDAIAQRWGCQESEDGKVVWADLAV
jgi:anti-sigma regulatory factor (Ser/Thr protein kinase)